MTKKQILLGVTGSIAAYKACELARLFVRAGHDVNVVMTRAATEFVTPLTFRTLSRNPVRVGLFDPPEAWVPEHISLADRCDIAVVAPCTANVIAKMANGIADDSLTSMLLAFNRPVLVAPAMNVNMWEHPATQRNIATLKERGILLLEPCEGELACGVSAKGRMPEPEEIYAATLPLLT